MRWGAAATKRGRPRDGDDEQTQRRRGGKSRERRRRKEVRWAMETKRMTSETALHGRHLLHDARRWDVKAVRERGKK
ncbi:uroporphyrinogen-III synthase HemD family protein [Sesbania bispinosa]|nr:uroporphyrinogen-III synthase HemD family protein [Sesbania bispinosa]